MTVPRRVDAASLLLSLDPQPWFVRHARAVAEVAGWLAARIDERGIAVDRRLVEAAALLHDADKALPADDPARMLPHGDGSAAWLARQGHPELARAVAGHPVTRLLDGTRYQRWAAFASREERIVAYADKRAGQRLESMDQRFASWRRRYPNLTTGDRQVAGWDDTALRAVRARAARLVADFARRLGEEAGTPLERWDIRFEKNRAAIEFEELLERLGTGVMFGGGTLAVAFNLGLAVTAKATRERLVATLKDLPPGNALVAVDLVESGKVKRAGG